MTKALRFFLAIVWLLCSSSLWAQNPVTKPCAPGTPVNNLPLVPSGAIWKNEHHHPGRETPPPNFHAAISHITVVNAVSCDTGGASRVSIRSWKVYEQRGKNSPKRLLQTITFNATSEENVDAGGIFPRIQMTARGHEVEKWYGETDGTGENDLVYDYEGGVYNVFPGKVARRLFHNWTGRRLDNKRDARYLVEMEVAIVGPARLQVGLDWWRGMDNAYSGFDLHCEDPKSEKNRSPYPANNCESWMSEWVGDTGGKYVTIRVPRAYWN